MNTPVHQQNRMAGSARRQGILEAAARVFAEYGFKQATMAEIARTASVAVGALYLVFENKEALRNALHEDRATRCWPIRRVQPPVKVTGAGVQRLTAAELVAAVTFRKWASAPMDRRQRETQNKRTAILVATEEVFRAKGPQAASMADIAVQAGVAKGTLYNFFTSKEELYFTLIEERLHEFFLYLQDEVEQATTTVDKIIRLIYAECAYFEANVGFFRIYVTTRSGFDWAAQADLGDRIYARIEVYQAWVTGIMETGVKNGELCAADPTDLACGADGYAQRLPV
ncbi:MAG: helix-turn-helix transcriptional regulator [Anaerolineales bacterium]|nr:helix-turn-helix transcriptional regulator [Anaerolineales bacterium]